MHFKLATLASLLSAVSAVDVGLWGSINCSGTLQACTNLPPNTCCSPPATYQTRSVQYLSKPATSTAYVFYRTTSSACGTYAGSTTADGSQNFCGNAPDPAQPLGGSGYMNVAAAKRRDAAADASLCTKSVAPDVLVLADGTRINIMGMAADQIDAITKLSKGPSYGVSLPRFSFAA